jgi:two-component system heavy metal sensor histidine kinase CusS
MNSIRRQLIALLLVGLSALFVLSGTMLYVYVQHALLGQFDEFMLGKAHTFAAASEDDNESVEFEFEEASIPAFQPSDEAEYYQVWDETANTVARSPSLGEGDLPFADVSDETPRFDDLLLPDGRVGRAVTIRFTPRASGDESQARHENEDGDEYTPNISKASFTLVMARSREELNHTLMAVLTGLCFTCLLLLTGSAGLVRWAVQRGLRPLDTVAAQAADVDADNLTCRFPAETMPGELQPICTRLNELFERLEVSFQRERRFTSDVAHELRTPIAELRSLAEVALQECRAGETDREGEQYFEDALDISLQMEKLVTVLLDLARCESGSQAVKVRNVDAAKIVEEAWAPFDKDARHRDLAVNLSLPKPVSVETDPVLLKAILSGLFSNAVTHTPSQGSIEIGTANGTDGFSLTISNTNDQLTPEDLGHIREPFWRKDDARSDHNHSGVGLSLVTEYARILDMEIDFDLPSLDTFSVTLKHAGN